jgi:hypothetical protein
LVGGACAPEERKRRDQNHHRKAEVGHDEAGRELVLDGVAAEHRLSGDAER